MDRLTYRGRNGKGYVRNQDYYNHVSLQLARVSERLTAYEDTGLEPEEVAAIKNELGTAKDAICQMCRKRGEEQHILCACVSCKYGGKQHGT